ncbi:hypothetical protein BVRB_9g217690 [Beta vulgaris subsp. vulgaris]|uniref:organ-specific protein S2 n=1 Tax=Beta vulgaris subsp. vulgaris TaxID=3555 RepID=UPI00053FA1A7|nr:organ-specific protein S2 [Beta vulgaris subsp. vulgaris]KMT00468.1 hypothetical protein BVRB_9g217690 [Beta vulgaris subsp. vulgaris]
MGCSIRILFTFLLSVILLAGPIDGRKSPGDYWVEIMKGQPIPESIKNFINQKSYEAHENEEGFIKDFDPVPNISAYHEYDDANPKELRSNNDDCNTKHDGLASKKLAVDEFEPRPNISIYKD